ncbi:hypothetical protein BT69DRAFT_1071863 [Atractiella rhizophila]|nr:hypothetical protein BT69DRAFT_1071863 [Atractiella rhizophila]
MDNDWQFKKRGMIRTQEVQEVWLADQLRHKENAIWAGWRGNVRSLLEAARNDADMDKSGLKIEMETIDEFDAKNEVRGVEGVQKIFPSPVAVPVTLDWHKRLRPDQNGWQLTPTEIENDMILFQAARESAAVEARRNEGRFDQVMHAQDIANSRPRRVPKDEAVVKESTKDRPLPKLQPKTPMPQPNLHIQPQYQSMLRPIQTKPVVPRYSHAELRTHVRSQLAAPSATFLHQPHNGPPPTSMEEHPESQLHGLHPPEPFPHPHTQIAHHFQPQLPTELLTQPQTGIHPQPQPSVHLAQPQPPPISPSVHSVNPIFNFRDDRSGDLPISNRLDSDTKLPPLVELSTATSVLVSSQSMKEQDERTRSESDTSGDSGVLRITKVQLPAIGQETHSGKDKEKENSDDDGILTITRLT